MQLNFMMFNVLGQNQQAAKITPVQDMKLV